jgi:GntR family transcriptional regulator
MLKRSPSLTDQAKAAIKERIVADEFEDGRIPSETDLADELGVSRTTIRDALSRLENEGVIFRKQGAGTFVNRPGLQISSRLDEIWSYEAVLRDHGYTPSTRILEVSSRPAGAQLANDLNLSAKDQVVVVEKLFLEDEEPVILARNHIPEGLINRPYTVEDLAAPVFEFIAEFSGQHLSYYLSDIVPVLAQGSLAERLHVPSPTGLLSLEEIGYNEDNEPILKAQSYFRDDLLRLRLIRRSV